MRGEEGGFITAGEDDARALSEEGLRNAAADASRAAGDEDDLVSEVEIHKADSRQ